MSLAKRSVTSITWTTLAGFIAYPVGLVQSIVLARLLPVETFGIYVGVLAISSISYIIFDFGLGQAFIHRSPETENEEMAVGIFFTLRLILDSIWASGLIGFGLIFLSGERQNVLFVLVLTSLLTKLTVAPRMILTRRVQHRRLVIIDLSVSLFSAFLSMLIAWYTGSIWALLISSVVGLVIPTLGLYLIKPVWRMRLAWDSAIVRYFFSFGGKNLIVSFLDNLLDNLDNLWTSYFLGDRQLGFYSRAFKFATYPRMLLALPINNVLMGTFAELKHDRNRLSKAFFRSSVFLTRSGFLLAGGLAVIAPEFITLLLGDKWLPMLNIFRLMLVFALLDPIRITVAGVLVAIGKPEKISLIRITQLIVLVAGLFSLGLLYQVTGVALSMNIMVSVGVILALYFVRSHVDFSLPRLLIPPILALIAGLGTIWLIMNVWPVDISWISLIVKGLAFSILYLGILGLIEGKILYQSFIEMIGYSALSQRLETVIRSRENHL